MAKKITKKGNPLKVHSNPAKSALDDLMEWADTPVVIEDTRTGELTVTTALDAHFYQFDYPKGHTDLDTSVRKDYIVIHPIEKLGPAAAILYGKKK